MREPLPERARHSLFSASDSPPDAGLLIGSSAVMRALRRELQAYVNCPLWVRLEGERGTGKNRAAEWLHKASGRRGAFVIRSLAVISADEGRQLGSLFGWKRGAFTGALDNHRGAFERAHGGTLFLNELGLTSPPVQQVLLELLEQREIVVERLGEEVARELDVRLLFGTNVNLAKAVRSDRFRADLLDRIGRNVIELPPLRTRLEDIPELCSNYLVKMGTALHRAPPELRASDLDRLMSYDWPGNVRELEKTLEPFIVTGRLPTDLPRAHRYMGVWALTVQRAIERAGGNKAAAARSLGVSRPTLYRRLRRTSGGGRRRRDSPSHM